MAKWKRNGTRATGIYDEDGHFIASGRTWQEAEQIITEHNAHAALLAVCKLAVEDAERAANPRARLAHYGAMVQAIALGKKTP